jgi:uncharacterized protein YjhX (UPF0386 family)
MFSSGHQTALQHKEISSNITRIQQAEYDDASIELYSSDGYIREGCDLIYFEESVQDARKSTEDRA